MWSWNKWNTICKWELWWLNKMLSLQEQNTQNKLVSYGWFWKAHLLKLKVFCFNYIWLLIGAVFHLFQGNLKDRSFWLEFRSRMNYVTGLSWVNLRCWAKLKIKFTFLFTSENLQCESLNVTQPKCILKITDLTS